MSAKKEPAAQQLSPSRKSKLDQQTPKWPELRATVVEETRTITINGTIRELSADRPRAQILQAATEQANRNGKPIRLTVTTAGGVERMIVTLDGQAVLLDSARDPHQVATPDAGTLPSTGVNKKQTKTAKSAKTPSGSRKGILGALPPAARPIVKWGGIAFVSVIVIAVAAALIAGSGGSSGEETPAAAPIPPTPAAAQLYTETPPPGWSQQAWWSVPIAKGSTTYTDTSTGYTVAITAGNNSTPETAAEPVADQHEANYLSVLSNTGQTVFATPVDGGAPKFGPVITTIDAAPVVLIGTTGEISYWPVTGGPETVIDLPQGGSTITVTGTSPLIELKDDKVAYIHDGALQTVQLLPRTEPVLAMDGSVIVTQDDNGAWWTLRTDASPTSIVPQPPAGAVDLERILGLTKTTAVIAWTTPEPTDNAAPTLILASYNLATGDLLATTEQPRTNVTGSPDVITNQTAALTAIGQVIITDDAITLVKGFRPVTAQDLIYGTQGNDQAVVDAAGKLAVVPDSTIVPVGLSDQHLMVISQDNLYALKPSTATG